MHIERAAHVDHGVSHSSSSAQMGLGIAGVAVGALVCAGPGVVACLGAIGLYGGLGLDAGKLVDKFQPASVSGKIVRGLPTVLLGPDVKHAARAHSDTIVDCDDVPVLEGSKTVMLGPERSPMSRRGDRAQCGGQIVEGLKTVLVGGAPSHEGEDITEVVPTALWWLQFGVGAAGVAKALATDGAWKAGTAAGAFIAGSAGQGDVANLLGAAGAGRLPSQGSIAQKLNWLSTVGQGSATGVRLGADVVTRP